MTPRKALPAGEGLVDVVEVLDGVTEVGEGASDGLATAAIDDGELEQRNLYGEAARIAARAASAGTRRQCAAIYRAFGDWLRARLGRPPVVGDLDVDAIAAYGRHLATSRGRGGRPAAPAIARVYVPMVRALARQLGRGDAIVKVLDRRHQAARRAGRV